MDDASLDDFLDAGEESDEDAEPNEGADLDKEAESEADANERTIDDANEKTIDDNATTEHSDDGADDAVAPATSTMTFSPDGVECEACGERVVRRWTDDDTLVCHDCKEW